MKLMKLKEAKACIAGKPIKGKPGKMKCETKKGKKKGCK